MSAREKFLQAEREALKAQDASRPSFTKKEKPAEKRKSISDGAGASSGSSLLAGGGLSGGLGGGGLGGIPPLASSGKDKDKDKEKEKKEKKDKKDKKDKKEKKEQRDSADATPAPESVASPVGPPPADAEEFAEMPPPPLPASESPPPKPKPVDPVAEALKSGAWKEVVQPGTGKTYYFNKATRKTTWDLKAELDKTAGAGSSSSPTAATASSVKATASSSSSKGATSSTTPPSAGTPAATPPSESIEPPVRRGSNSAGEQLRPTFATPLTTSDQPQTSDPNQFVHQDQHFNDDPTAYAQQQQLQQQNQQQLQLHQQSGVGGVGGGRSIGDELRSITTAGPAPTATGLGDNLTTASSLYNGAPNPNGGIGAELRGSQHAGFTRPGYPGNPHTSSPQSHFGGGAGVGGSSSGLNSGGGGLGGGPGSTINTAGSMQEMRYQDPVERILQHNEQLQKIIASGGTGQAARDAQTKIDALERANMALASQLERTRVEHEGMTKSLTHANERIQSLELQLSTSLAEIDNLSNGRAKEMSQEEETKLTLSHLRDQNRVLVQNISELTTLLARGVHETAAANADALYIGGKPIRQYADLHSKSSNGGVSGGSGGGGAFSSGAPHSPGSNPRVHFTGIGEASMEGGGGASVVTRFLDSAARHTLCPKCILSCTRFRDTLLTGSDSNVGRRGKNAPPSTVSSSTRGSSDPRHQSLGSGGHRDPAAAGGGGLPGRASGVIEDVYEPVPAMTNPPPSQYYSEPTTTGPRHEQNGAPFSHSHARQQVSDPRAHPYSSHQGPGQQQPPAAAGAARGAGASANHPQNSSRAAAVAAPAIGSAASHIGGRGHLPPSPYDGTQPRADGGVMFGGFVVRNPQLQE